MQIYSWCKWRHLVAKFATNVYAAMWLHVGVNSWVRCASGNICLLPLPCRCEAEHCRLEVGVGRGAQAEPLLFNQPRYQVNLRCFHVSLRERSARILVLARFHENWLTFLSLDLDTSNLCFSFSSHENNKMKISISSHQVRASNIILVLVSKNCSFFHISHDILKSIYMMLHNIFSQTVDGTPTKESEVLLFLVIFSICVIR